MDRCYCIFPSILGLASDVNLCIDIWLNEDILSRTDELKILLIGIGSAFFVLVPYCKLNYCHQNKNDIRCNESAKSWYVNNLYLYILIILKRFFGSDI